MTQAGITTKQTAKANSLPRTDKNIAPSSPHLRSARHAQFDEHDTGNSHRRQITGGAIAAPTAARLVQHGARCYNASTDDEKAALFQHNRVTDDKLAKPRCDCTIDDHTARHRAKVAMSQLVPLHRRARQARKSLHLRW